VVLLLACFKNISAPSSSEPSLVIFVLPVTATPLLVVSNFLAPPVKYNSATPLLLKNTLFPVAVPIFTLSPHILKSPVPPSVIYELLPSWNISKSAELPNLAFTLSLNNICLLVTV